MESTLGENAQSRFTDEAADAVRTAIAEADGQEVFFAAALDPDGLLVSVRVCARGHDGAVPAVFDTLQPRDVVIHNHPGGNIHPSDADLDLAVVYSHNGHGVYIVDNEVTRVYVVIEPFLDKNRTLLNAQSLKEIIAPDGPVASQLQDYEPRSQQEEMLEAVSEAFNRDGIAVVEAPTGVGKTLAYLLPAVTWALTNRERVIISTRTINLQEQIVYKDIPLVQRSLDEKFTAVLVKGRANYVCLARLERALSEATLFDEGEETDSLKAIKEWAEQTEDGTKSDLSFVPKRETWERVCSDADTCTPSQCMRRGDCFLSKARREIAKAEIVVVNHHMLFSDLAIKKEMGSFTSLAVLPAYERLILDEAHHIEDSATEYFGMEATQNGALALLGRFQRKERGRERGLLPLIKMKLVQDSPRLAQRDVDKILGLIDNAMLPAIATCREALTTTFQSIRSLCAERCKQVGRDIKWRLTEEALADAELREIHSVYVIPSVEEVATLGKHTGMLIRLLKKIEPADDQDEHPLAIELAQLQSNERRLSRLANSLAESTSPDLETNTVRWIEIDAEKGNIVRLIRCPLEVGKPLSEWVYPNLKSIVMTSATLSVRNDFGFLFSRIGLNAVADRPVQSVCITSPFDHEKQAILCAPADIAAPDQKEFQAMSIDYIRDILAISKGRAFVLYTSFYALNIAYAALEDDLRELGITPLKQGGASRTQLLERFQRDTSSVLFATDSFWEGVDVPGESLQCVILTRLPFRVPTEPILQARTESIEQSGGNAFMEYTVPLAVIKFRQGFGRLIRRRSDWGAVVILDSRVLTKRYGRQFLDSLPTAMRVVKGPRKGVRLALETFFNNHRNAKT